MRIVRVLAPNPSVHTLEGTNTWIVGRDPAIVIDPGPDDPAHLREVARTAGPTGSIVVTHEHPDHAPGAPSLAETTGAAVLAFRPPKGGERLREGQMIRGGNALLQVLHTPGHTADHVALFNVESGALFTGDAVLGRGTSVIDPAEGDLEAYLRSLHHMRELPVRTIYPGHGPVVLDAAAKLDEYVEHREMRERQILDGLKDEPRTIDELVAEIYIDYPREAQPLATRSVLAHLVKLEREGRVVRSGGGDAARYEMSEPRPCERCGRPVRGRMPLCGRCSLAVLQERPEG